MRGRQQKAKVVSPKRLGGCLRRQGDRHTQRFKDVSGAAFAGHGAVAVLGHLDASGCRHKRSSSGDVEGPGAVAAGATGIEELLPLGLAERKGGGCSAHGGRKAGQLGRGLATGAHAAEQGGEFQIRSLPRENALQQRRRLRGRKRPLFFHHETEFCLDTHSL